jgi:serine palmitoyltransferase
MGLYDAHQAVLRYCDVASTQFQKVPGSAILLRYIKSSYQNDPARSAIELILFLFAIGYLLSPSYSTVKPNKVVLTEDVCRAHVGDFRGWGLS